MGTCIIDKIGSLKRNKGEVSFLAPSFLGDVTCTYGHVCPIKLCFCFFCCCSRVGAYSFTNPTHYSARPPSPASCT